MESISNGVTFVSGESVFLQENAKDIRHNANRYFNDSRLIADFFQP